MHPTPKAQKIDWSKFGKVIFSVGSEGTGDGQFTRPTTVAITNHSEIIICDAGNNRVQVFNDCGNFKFKFASAGSGDGQLNNPFCVAADSHNRIVVTDTGNSRVQVFDPHGKFLYAFGSKGVGNGQMMEPKGVVINTNDRAVVIDGAGDHSVMTFDLKEGGKFFNKYDAETEPYTGHKYVAVDKRNNNILITDTQRNCLKVFSEAGQLVANYPYSEPFDVAVADDGKIIMIDNNHGLRLFDDKMNFLHQYQRNFFGHTTHASAMGIAVDHQDHTLITVECPANKFHKIGYYPF